MVKKLTEVATKLAKKPAAKRQVIYIVDFENIPKTDVAALLRKRNVVMVVLAANRTNTVTPETLATIEAHPDRVEVIIGRITRKEFVDKLVTAKIGEYAFRFPEAEIVVLANDRDYTDLAAHLNDHWERAVPIKHEAPHSRSASATTKKKERTGVAKRGGSRAKAATERRAAKPITNPDAEAIRVLLAKLPKRQLPKAESALLNAVRNYRESVGLRSRPSTIVKHLIECGYIEVGPRGVRYAL